MTVNELKQALSGVAGETPVIALVDGRDDYLAVSSAEFDDQEDEDGGKYNKLVIYVMNRPPW
jgi:hypothetical protein